MYTSVALVAMSGMLACSEIPMEPSWLNEYGKARQVGEKEKKPLAVFIGAGKSGWNKVSQDGQLGKEVKQLLAQQYVCLYINTEETAGKRLAQQFEVPDGLGLVISNREGNLQAFRHEGDFSNQDLERYLTRFADPKRVTMQTETNPSSRVSYYQPAPVQNYVPAYSAPMMSGRSC